MKAAMLGSCALLLLGACERAPAPGGDLSEPEDMALSGAGLGTAASNPAETLAAVQRGSPEDVVRLLLQWDTAGLRFEGPYADALIGLYCYLPDQQCLSEEPAWDFALAVRGFQLDELFASSDSAQYEVLFDELGLLWPDGMEEPTGTPPETLSLRRLDGRWRVVGSASQMPPHLSIAGVQRRYRGVHPDSAVLAQWLEDRARPD